MSDRKKKLETSLEGLFSRPQDQDKLTQSEKKEVAPSSAATTVPAKPAVKKKETSKPVEVKKSAQKSVPVKKAQPVDKKSNAAAPQSKEIPSVETEKVEIPVQVVKVEVVDSVVEKATIESPVAKVEPVSPPVNQESGAAAPAVSKPTASGDLAMVVSGNRELAVQATEGAEDIQLLVFEINQVAYGIDVSMVQTIIKPQQVFLVPGTVNYLKGLINLRGAVVPVIDMRTRFDLPEGELDKDTRFVVVECDDIMASMVVDKVQGVETIPMNVIERPSGLVMDIDNRYLTGMARYNDQIILILDLLQAIRPEKVEQH